MKKLKQMSGPYSIGFELSSTAHGFVATDPNGNVLYHGKQRRVSCRKQMQEFACSISRKDLQDLADLAMQVYRNPDELPFTYFRPIRDRLYSWGFDAIKDAQAVMYLGRGDYDSYQIARNDLEDSGWLSPEIEINSLDKIPLGEYLQAGISKMKSTDWA